MPGANGKTEDLKTVKVDVQAVIEEVRKKGLLTPDAAPALAPKPTAPAAPVVTGGRILG
jgi:hypothetical protein